MTRIKIAQDDYPHTVKWITVPSKVVDLSREGSWYTKMLAIHLFDVPSGYHAVAFETIGGTWLHPETSDDRKRDLGLMQNST